MDRRYLLIYRWLKNDFRWFDTKEQMFQFAKDRQPELGFYFAKEIVQSNDLEDELNEFLSSQEEA